MKNLKLKEEFIGKKIEIINSKNKSMIGVSGTIIDETKNTFKIRKQGEKIITIMKKNNTFLIDKITIKGNNIIMRSEDRIKKL
ncbi:MAG: ribonuclease P protein subunit [Candidatus Woesearchaeota archaeon]